MTDIVTLPAAKREKLGRGAARAARRAERVPAVIYGGDGAPESITIEKRLIDREILKGGFMKTLLNIDVDGTVTRVLPKDVQLDPVRDWPVHIDFIRMGKGARTAVFVPVEFLNEGTSVGLKRGGVLNVVRQDVELMVDVDNIPEKIEIDLAERNIGDSIHVDDVTLPAGTTPTIRRNFTIATIAAPSGGVKDEGEGDEGEAEEGAEE